MTNDIHTRWHTALHEAGHAVATYRLGLHLGRSTIRPDHDRDVLGWNLGEGAWMDGSKDEDCIVVLYAGLAAVLNLAPAAYAAAEREGAAGDYEQAAELLRHETVTSDQATLEQRAAALVKQHRTEIEVIAMALIEEGTLETEDQGAIMDAVVDGEDWRGVLAQHRVNARPDPIAEPDDYFEDALLRAFKAEVARRARLKDSGAT